MYLNSFHDLSSFTYLPSFNVFFFFLTVLSFFYFLFFPQTTFFHSFISFTKLFFLQKYSSKKFITRSKTWRFLTFNFDPLYTPQDIHESLRLFKNAVAVICSIAVSLHLLTVVRIECKIFSQYLQIQVTLPAFPKRK